MMSPTERISYTPVRKSITVKVTPDRAFRVFTDEIDSWWPRSHHIGKAPMSKNLIEGRPGGRCFSEHTDGTSCQWGTILLWNPPHRFTLAWQVGPSWQREPDLAKSSEVEVTFTPEGDGLTRVDLEHRYFERHGPGFEAMRTAVDDPEGWNGLLRSFEARIAQTN
jgi:uncharacterized protein YndB with AHSA1/START domain